MLDETGSICQSCAMPLSQDPQGGGTNQDGSKSADYCSFCYREGSFVDPDVSMDQFVAKLEKIMAGMHLPPGIIQVAKEKLPSLKRWKAH